MGKIFFPSEIRSSSNSLTKIQQNFSAFFLYLKNVLQKNKIKIVIMLSTTILQGNQLLIPGNFSMQNTFSSHLHLDRIEIRGLRINMIIGVLEQEKNTPQPIEFDITIFTDLSKACESDCLTDTIDYGQICVLIEQLAHTHHDSLLEKFAHRVSELILLQPKVDSVEISIKKLHPPVESKLNNCGVSLLRRRFSPPHSSTQHQVIVALGSNLGDRSAYLRYALDRLGIVLAQSQIFETKPVGGPLGQGLFLNMTAIIQTALDPYAFHRKCLEIETHAHRKRDVHWGERTLDIDILFYDDLCINDPLLTIPHPRINERGFVLAPLAEIAPEKLPPLWKTSIDLSEIQPLGMLNALI